MKLITKVATLAAAFLTFPLTPFAADFYLKMEDCKIAAAPLVVSEPIKVGRGETSITSCDRNSKKIVCSISFLEGGVKAQNGLLEYHVEMDSGPLLIFTDDKFADYYVINRNRHSVAVITRMIGSSFDVVGAKICNGIYATNSELELSE